MFEDLINEMRLMSELSVSVEIETDENGYIDKQCPNEKCEFIFKVNGEDWANIFNDDAVWCPLCRHEATSVQWFTADQYEHAKSEAKNNSELQKMDMPSDFFTRTSVSGKYLGWNLSPRKIDLTYLESVVSKLSKQMQ